ncbi:MAG: hypothetical protein LBU04_08065 [Christensenellaceae bacterium]|nr:hypothetical protein [Christensenellaceae bacterium]
MTVLATAILILCIMIAVACKPPETPPTDAGSSSSETSDSLLIANGTFASGTSSTGSAAYIKDTVTGWTKNNAASYYSDAKMGVVDVSAEVFQTKRDELTALEISGPGVSPRTPKDEEGVYTDTNALVLGLDKDVKGSVYFKNSSAVTITKNKYYKLEIDVFTQLSEKENELEGAYIVVNSGIYTVFTAIDASTAWKTYTIYIEANNFEDRTFYIELWLGHGPKYIGTQIDENLNPRLTKGFVFIDNVSLTDITPDDGAKEYISKNSEITNNAPNVIEGVFGTVAFASLVFPDKSFTYYKAYTYSSYTSYSKYYYGVKPGMHNNYSVIVGGSDITATSDFPSYDSQTSTSGIIDMSQLYNLVNTATDDGTPQYEHTDVFKTLTDTFRAPDWRDFFEVNDGVDVFGFYTTRYNDAFGTLNTLDRVYNTFNGDSTDYSSPVLMDTTALMIYHPNFAVSGAGMKSNQQFLIEKHKYYDISVWVYVWVPKFDLVEPTPDSSAIMVKPEPASYDAGEEDEQYIADLASYNSANNQEKITSYNTKHTEWQKLRDEYAIAIKNGQYKAEFRLTGASIESGSLTKSTAQITPNEDDTNLPYVDGSWQQLTFRIKGNELSDRKVNLEFWYGEGEWGSDGLVTGGAIFDDISIISGDNPLNNDSSLYETISPINADESEEFGLVGNDTAFASTNYIEFTENTEEQPWKFDFADKRNAADNSVATAGMIYGKTASNSEDWAKFADEEMGNPNLSKPYGETPLQVDKEGTPYIFDVIMLYNKAYTATTLTYSQLQSVDGETERVYKTALKNNFYRVSMWVKTDAIDESSGVTIDLIDNADGSLSSLTSINTKGEWQEISFYIRGSTISDTEYALKYQLGSGDLFTPATHIKGALYVTAIIIKKINYSEYNSATTDSYTAKKQISDIPSTENTITNGYFADLSTSNYDLADDADPIFNEAGELIGVATPNSWTYTSAVDAITTPTNLTIDTSGTTPMLTWKRLPGFEKGDTTDPHENLVYYIYIDGVSWPDPDDASAAPIKKDNVLIGKLPQTEDGTAPKFEIPIFSEGSFKVRAIYLPTADSLPSREAGIQVGISAYSSTIKNSAIKPTDATVADAIDYSSEDIKKAAFGVIDYKTYSSEKLGVTDSTRDDFYTNGKINDSENIQWISGQANTLLMLSSEYYTRGGYYAASSSLSADSYYMLSVWVKTLGDAKASITVNNTSKIFSNTGVTEPTDGDYVGYVNINTSNEWKQYRFYMKTLVSTASFQLELFLGNKYAEAYTVKNDDDTTNYTVMHGLTKGTVFFDDITFKSLTVDQYNNLVFGGDPSEIDESEYLEELKEYVLKDKPTDEFFSNKYMFKLLDYTTDSFDLFSAPSTSQASQGGSPNDYTHYVASGGTDYSSGSETTGDQVMQYGVYDKRKINNSSEIIESILSSNVDSDSRTRWLGDISEKEIIEFMTTDVGNGNHYLLMANLIQNGQYYLSQTSISIATKSYYKVTFYAKTWFETTDNYAEFRFEYGNDTTKWSSIRIYGNSNTMKEYTFYVYNDDPTTAVSSNNISFHLGSNGNTASATAPDNFFRGMIIIDDISIEKLTDGSDIFEDHLTKYNALTDEEKTKATYAAHQFDEAKTADSTSDVDDGEDEKEKTPISSTVWLMISSIVIGAIIIAVVVVLVARRIKKKIGKAIPQKVISNVPVNLADINSAPDQVKADDRKAEIEDDEFTDELDLAPRQKNDNSFKNPKVYSPSKKKKRGKR